MDQRNIMMEEEEVVDTRRRKRTRTILIRNVGVIRIMGIDHQIILDSRSNNRIMVVVAEMPHHRPISIISIPNNTLERAERQILIMNSKRKMVEKKDKQF